MSYLYALVALMFPQKLSSHHSRVDFSHTSSAQLSSHTHLRPVAAALGGALVREDAVALRSSSSSTQALRELLVVELRRRRREWVAIVAVVVVSLARAPPIVIPILLLLELVQISLVV